MTGDRENLKPDSSLRSSRFDLSDWEKLLQEQTGGADKVNSGSSRKTQWNPPYCGKLDMRIGPDGVWYYYGSPIVRHSMVRLFASVLRRESDGIYYLVTPVEKFAIEVMDAPFLAVDIKIEQRDQNSRQRLHFRTNVDDVVCVSKEHPIRFEGDPATEGLKPYIFVRNRLEALVTRSLYYDLVEMAVVEVVNGEKSIGLWSSGTFYPMAPADMVL